MTQFDIGISHFDVPTSDKFDFTGHFTLDTAEWDDTLPDGEANPQQALAIAAGVLIREHKEPLASIVVLSATSTKDNWDGGTTAFFEPTDYWMEFEEFPPKKKPNLGPAIKNIIANISFGGIQPMPTDNATASVEEQVQPAATTAKSAKKTTVAVAAPAETTAAPVTNTSRLVMANPKGINLDFIFHSRPEESDLDFVARINELANDLLEKGFTKAEFTSRFGGGGGKGNFGGNKPKYDTRYHFMGIKRVGEKGIKMMLYQKNQDGSPNTEKYAIGAWASDVRGMLEGVGIDIPDDLAEEMVADQKPRKLPYPLDAKKEKDANNYNVLVGVSKAAEGDTAEGSDDQAERRAKRPF